MNDFQSRISNATALAATFACGFLAAAAAGAQVRTKGVTGGLESSTEFTSLPAIPGGSLNVKECGDCPSLRLEFRADTRYFIGDEPVSYAELRQAADDGVHGLLVSYRLGTRDLTRLRLSAPGN
ncbi:MAG TPA: hypothetical protein VJ813_01925 [Vicinamibacterales bacterium]|nr:hypothetical protein [Vicinamibacterales bacterium]